MKNYGKFFLFALGLTALLALLSGCGSASAKKKVTVLLDWVPNTNHTGLYVALEKGYYANVGLEVEIIQPSEGSTEVLVGTGKADFGVSYQENITYALTGAEPIPIRAIAAIIQHNTSGFAAPASKGIRTVADFAGKTYGGWGSPSEEAVIRLAAEKAGINFNSIRIVSLGQDDFFAAVTGEIDFAWVYEATTLIEAQNNGVALNYIPVRDLDPALDYYTPVLITGAKLAEDNPKRVSDFLTATAKGYEYAITNPAESAEILLKHAPELDEYIVVNGQKYLAGKYREDSSQWGIMKTEIWQAYADLMYKNGLIENPLDLSKAFTNQFLPKQ